MIAPHIISLHPITSKLLSSLLLPFFTYFSSNHPHPMHFKSPLIPTLGTLGILLNFPLQIQASASSIQIQSRDPPFTTIAPTTTSAIETETQSLLQQNTACAQVSSSLFACESKTAGFTTLVPGVQARCLCYDYDDDGMIWEPKNFDEAVKVCAEFASTAVPGAYRAFVDLVGTHSLLW